MPVPVMDIEVIEANHVLLHCDDFYVLVAQFRPGSVRVNEEEPVQTGDLLGEVGIRGGQRNPICTSAPNDPVQSASRFLAILLQ